MIDHIIENYPDEEFLKADGFDDAIIGVDETSMRLIYSVSKCLEILQEDMSEIDAIEHFTYNVSGAYVGEKTPIWCWDDYPKESSDVIDRVVEMVRYTATEIHSSYDLSIEDAESIVDDFLEEER